MDYATGVHVTRSGEYINGSDRGLVRDRCVCTVSECCLAGTHLGRLCCLAHGSGWVCSGSADSRLRFALTSIPESQRAVPLALTLLWGARLIAWHLRCPFLGECRRDPRHFWATALHLDLAKKNALCYTRPVGRTKDIYWLKRMQNRCEM